MLLTYQENRLQAVATGALPPAVRILASLQGRKQVCLPPPPFLPRSELCPDIWCSSWALSRL